MKRILIIKAIKGKLMIDSEELSFSQMINKTPMRTLTKREKLLVDYADATGECILEVGEMNEKYINEQEIINSVRVEPNFRIWDREETASFDLARPYIYAGVQIFGSRSDGLFVCAEVYQSEVLVFMEDSRNGCIDYIVSCPITDISLKDDQSLIKQIHNIAHWEPVAKVKECLRCQCSDKIFTKNGMHRY